MARVLAGLPPNVLASAAGNGQTVLGWLQRINRLFLQVRRGEIPPEVGSKLAYIANIGGTLARSQEELLKLERLRIELEQLRTGAQLLPAQEFLPASPTDDDESQTKESIDE